MTRAERRRLARQEKKNRATYNLNHDQISNLIQEEYRDTIKWNRLDAYNEAVTDAFIMMMALPLKVLKDHYWQKTHQKRFPEFANYILEEFNSWQNGDLDLEELVAELERESKVRLIYKEE